MTLSPQVYSVLGDRLDCAELLLKAGGNVILVGLDSVSFLQLKHIFLEIILYPSLDVFGFELFPGVEKVFGWNFLFK